MVLLVNALLTVGFVFLFALSVWVSRRLLGADSGPDLPRHIDDDQLANSA